MADEPYDIVGSSANPYVNQYYYPGDPLFGYNLEWSHYNQSKQDWSSEHGLPMNESTRDISVGDLTKAVSQALQEARGNIGHMTKEAAQALQECKVDNWVHGLRMTVRGCVKEDLLKAGNICRVPERIREANKEKSDKWYRPKFVAIGPLHRRATIDLQTMEFSKWYYLRDLFLRPTHPEKYYKLNLHDSSAMIQTLESVLRASYGDNVEIPSEEFSTMMLLDACFLLELLLRLHDHLTDDDRAQDFIPDYINKDPKKMSRLLTDLTLLENQIPFFLLNYLSRILLKNDDRGRRVIGQESDQEEACLAPIYELMNEEGKKLSPIKLAEFLFNCDVERLGDSPKSTYHFLHLIHWCTPDPYDPKHYQGQAPLQLRYCARKLQALGIQIISKRTTPPGHAALNNNGAVNNNMTYEQVEEYMENYFQIDFNAEERNNNNMASDAIEEFMDRFEFQIDFNAAERKLTIPTLHIKEATEIKWRNFIAWEQVGRLIGVGYKFTSYAYFFKDLVCYVDDIQLLKDKGVIRVHNPDAKDEDLLILFQSLVTGATDWDGRYNEVCEGLNRAEVSVGMGGSWVYRSLRHYWRRFVEWLNRGLISLLGSFINTYLGTPWKFVGVISAVALLVLTLTQTIYAIRQAK